MSALSRRVDRMDVKILRALQAEGRITNLDLAEKVGLSPAPCLRRVRALEESGIISRYVALLEPAKIGLSLEIAVDVRLKAQTREFMQSFERRIVALPQIIECSMVAGEWDYALRVLMPDLDAYQNFQLDCLMKGDSEIAALRSTIIMRKIKRTTSLNVQATPQ